MSVGNITFANMRTNHDDRGNWDLKQCIVFNGSHPVVFNLIQVYILPKHVVYLINIF